MIFVQYQKDLIVRKQGTGFNSAQRNSKRRGVTVSTEPFHRPKSSAWYAEVLWDGSTRPEYECLNLLHIIPNEVQEAA